jgi:hypothetical protein
MHNVKLLGTQVPLQEGRAIQQHSQHAWQHWAYMLAECAASQSVSFPPDVPGQVIQHHAVQSLEPQFICMAANLQASVGSSPATIEGAVSRYRLHPPLLGSLPPHPRHLRTP